MNIEIIGPLGSGKGTQARLLVEKYGFFYLESGDILRNVAKSDPKISEIINTKGKLIPDEEAVEIFKNLLLENKPDLDNVLFDGFPRTLPQYKLFAQWLGENAKKIDNVILLDISDEEAIKRTSARRYCGKCGQIYNLITEPPKADVCDKCGGTLLQRPDDTPEAIKTRLGWYKEVTLPLVDEFENLGILLRIDGERPVEEIFQDIVSQLKI